MRQALFSCGGWSTGGAEYSYLSWRDSLHPHRVKGSSEQEEGSSMALRSSIIYSIRFSLQCSHVFSSVQSINHVHGLTLSCSLWPHGLQHVRLSCLSPTPGACSNLSPLSWWCHPIISSSVVPFSSCFNLSQHQDLFKLVWVTHL